MKKTTVATNSHNDCACCEHIWLASHLFLFAFFIFTLLHFILAGAVICALIILLPSVFSLMVGSNFGGVLGDIVGSAVRWNTGIVPVGLVAGIIAAAFSDSLIVGSLIGGFLGKALASVLSYSTLR